MSYSNQEMFNTHNMRHQHMPIPLLTSEITPVGRHQSRHLHPMSVALERQHLCCPRHLIEVCSFLKQQVSLKLKDRHRGDTTRQEIRLFISSSLKTVSVSSRLQILTQGKLLCFCATSTPLDLQSRALLKRHPKSSSMQSNCLKGRFFFKRTKRKHHL